MRDLRSRLDSRVMISTDGFGAYPHAIDAEFGNEVDYYQMLGTDGPRGMGGIHNSYVERHNLTMRQSVRRLTRRTNAFSKKFRNHVASLALYFTYYNFCRVHSSIGTTPVVAAGLDNAPRGLMWVRDDR